MKRIFAVDIDNTISDSYIRFLEYRKLGYEKITKEIIDEKFNSQHKPINDAQKSLKELSKYYEIVYVSARRPEHEEVTLRWLNKYEFPMDRLFLVSQNNFKLYTLRQLRPIVFVDDMKYNYENFEPKLCTDFMSMLRDEGINYEIFDNNWKDILQKYMGVR